MNVAQRPLVVSGSIEKWRQIVSSSNSNLSRSCYCCRRHRVTCNCVLLHYITTTLTYSQLTTGQALVSCALMNKWRRRRFVYSAAWPPPPPNLPRCRHRSCCCLMEDECEIRSPLAPAPTPTTLGHYFSLFVLVKILAAKRQKQPQTSIEASYSFNSLAMLCFAIQSQSQSESDDSRRSAHEQLRQQLCVCTGYRLRTIWIDRFASWITRTHKRRSMLCRVSGH